MQIPKATKTKLHRARDFRKNPTEAESRAWDILRNRQVLGLKFRRQKVVYGFIADFYCAERALVIEVDGPIHDREEHAKADEERRRALERAGIHVLRIKNEEIDLTTMTDLIQSYLNATTPPSPKESSGATP